MRKKKTETPVPSLVRFYKIDRDIIKRIMRRYHLRKAESVRHALRNYAELNDL